MVLWLYLLSIFISKIHIYVLNDIWDLHQNNGCGQEEWLGGTNEINCLSCNCSNWVLGT